MYVSSWRDKLKKHFDFFARNNDAAAAAQQTGALRTGAVHLSSENLPNVNMPTWTLCLCAAFPVPGPKTTSEQKADRH